jgi:predicted nucleotidyltransferase component of viral defense system
LNRDYLDTARLLTQVAPLLFVDDVFALKGGTAINLFIRDMPRLSVDLDLVFTDHRLRREEALARIAEAVKAAKERLKRHGFQTYVPKAANADETKLFVQRAKLQVKVEVNTVVRGSVHPVRRASLTARARDVLQADLELPVLSLEDLYGGKLAAAMDRQHPRDLFDVMELLRNEGITPAIRRSFVAYLAVHNRPVHEVLFPNLRDVSGEYERTFRGMTSEPVALDMLLAARERMVKELQNELDAAERDFLISLVRNEPNWDLLGISHLEQMPGVRWKLENLGRLAKSDPKKFRAQAEELERKLSKA